MKITSLKALLIGFALLTSGIVSAEVAQEQRESAAQKEQRIEKDLNELFLNGMNSAAVRLDKTQQVKPFAVMKRADGTIGTFEIKDTEKSKSMSVMDKALSVRKLLIELAAEKQIVASVLVMYATVGKKGEKPRQGLTFEVEHAEGVSMMRFLPVTQKPLENDQINPTLVFEIESIVSTAKPKTVFR